MSLDESLRLLQQAGVLFDKDDECGEQTLNMNDVWGWATAWGEAIPDDELDTVAQLFIQYGWCGILYWMSERHDRMRSEFADINRFVEFVRQEEMIKKECPDDNKRAYLKRVYPIGEQA